MSKIFLLIALTLTTILSAEANNCSIKLDLGGEFDPEVEEPQVRSQMVEALAKKGYRATESVDAEYTLKVNYGHMMTTTNCFVWAAGVQVMNSGKQVVADEFAEASIFRLTFRKRSIAKAMTLKAFKKALRTMPVCE